MAGANRGPSADLNASRTAELKKELLTNGRGFSFFQALRLLQHFKRQETGTDPRPEDFDDLIRIRPNLTLGFPSADIDRIEAVETGQGARYHITATYLGLYGTSSPLPTFYTEDLMAEEREDETVSRDFLDIFNHRLYLILHRAWLKYRQFLQVTEEKNHLHLERLYCLLGLGADKLRQDLDNPYRLLRYIGLFTQYPRSGLGLATLLQDAFNDVPVDIVPCILRKAKIPEDQRLKMGMSGCFVGVNSYLGEEIDDRMGKFRVQIGPLTQAQFLRFTPGNSGYNLLVSLTELYITEPLAYEVELILAAKEAKTVSLGDPIRSVLGVTSWVYSLEYLGEVRTRFDVNRS